MKISGPLTTSTTESTVIEEVETIEDLVEDDVQGAGIDEQEEYREIIQGLRNNEELWDI